MKKVLVMIMCVCFLLSSTMISSTIYAEEGSSETEDGVLTGAPSQKAWTFKADKAGSYTIKFSYARPWEASAIAETETYQLKVTEDGNSARSAVVLKTGIVNEVKVNQKFTVMLTENVSTGYSWSYEADSDAVKLVGEKDIPVLVSDTANVIKKGQEFAIILTENASTGYSWSYTINGKGIKLVNEDMISTNSDEDIVGAPSQRVWTFKAKKTGNYTLKFSYARSWETDTSAAETITYTVKVK